MTDFLIEHTTSETDWLWSYQSLMLIRIWMKEE